MTDVERIEHRLAAVERAVIDGDYEVDELAELATLTETVERLESRVDEQEQRLAALEARTESLSGFVDNVESVNDGVERQAASAVATVDRLEDRIDELEGALEGVRRETQDQDQNRGCNGQPKAIDAGEPSRTDDQQEPATTTEVAFSEAERSTGDSDSSSPEKAVSEIVGDGDGSGNGNGNGNGDFEWIDGEDGDDRPFTESTASQPGASELGAAEQESVDRVLGETGDGGSDAGTGEADAATDDPDGEGSTESDGILSTVRSKLS